METVGFKFWGGKYINKYHSSKVMKNDREGNFEINGWDGRVRNQVQGAKDQDQGMVHLKNISEKF